jgi:hypothetical protein
LGDLPACTKPGPAHDWAAAPRLPPPASVSAAEALCPSPAHPVEGRRQLFRGRRGEWRGRSPPPAFPSTSLPELAAARFGTKPRRRQEAAAAQPPAAAARKGRDAPGRPRKVRPQRGAGGGETSLAASRADGRRARSGPRGPRTPRRGAAGACGACRAGSAGARREAQARLRRERRLGSETRRQENELNSLCPVGCG